MELTQPQAQFGPFPFNSLSIPFRFLFDSVSVPFQFPFDSLSIPFRFPVNSFCGISEPNGEPRKYRLLGKIGFRQTF